MTKYIPFYFDDKGFYQNDKSFMITGCHVAYLTAFLNSSLFKFCFLDNFPELQGGTRELRKISSSSCALSPYSGMLNILYCIFSKISTAPRAVFLSRLSGSVPSCGLVPRPP